MQGVKVSVGDRRKGVVGKCELAIEGNGERLPRPQAQPRHTGVDVVALLGRDALKWAGKIGEIQKLRGSNLTLGVVVATIEADYRGKSIVDVS